MKKNKNSFLLKTFINSIAIYAAASIIKGVNIEGFIPALVASLVFGIVNALIKPILIIFSLPINIMSLGLFTFVINGISLLIVSGITAGFTISDLGAAILASIIISIVSSIINFLIS
ncbi:phage holin family protein [Fonticella tunisiensis]|uniref:Putative membrane protein n=1 Tax=Fonticella tunisiensis TaxID=1096341 RepID=A0A4R7K424_9CLOT|nr:phage holin family protein [Fonticella tunisiensis]TDT45660.1 putative membrane protein [Fonticella tunisiensis]